jgi:predicted GTPase
MDGWDIISAEEKEDLQRMVKETGVKNIPDYISRKTKQWKDVHINIAIVGETYVSKSTFINQLRGLKEWDNGFASVGLGDTTLEPTLYENPYNANMVCWDLPGVGTLRFPKDDSYLETIKIDRYDLFVIISDACFSENDAWLARNILNRGKPFSLVRTKLDEAMTNASYDGHKMEKLCQEFTKVVMIILEKLISESQKYS